MYKSVFYKFLSYRLLSVFVIQTYFVPDEYWQSLEVAHLSVFDYGYSTWEFREKIRSWIYPSIFSLFYKLLHILAFDYLALIIYGPRIIQAVITAFADSCLYKLCAFRNVPSRHIWDICLLDWFSFYCGSRTIINTFESNLVTFGLAILFETRNFPSKMSVQRLGLFAALVSIICFIRPTACLIWAPFCVMILWLYGNKSQFLAVFLAVGSSVGVMLVLIDSLIYQSLSITPLNFFFFNVVKGVSSFYGSHGPFWYFTQGLPVVLGLHCLPFLLHIYYLLRNLGQGKINSKIRDDLLLLGTIAISLLTYSLVPHKEFRFLLPLVPMIKLLAVQQVEFLNHGKRKLIYMWSHIAAFVLPALYFGLIHQRGTMSVMSHLAVSTPKSILFLMPCHSTPYYSHLHLHIPMRFITCEPPINAHQKDEGAIFYANPSLWLDQYFMDTIQHPSHIVMFNHLEKQIGKKLRHRNYTHSASFFHTFSPEGKVGSSVEVYEKNYIT